MCCVYETVGIQIFSRNVFMYAEPWLGLELFYWCPAPNLGQEALSSSSIYYPGEFSLLAGVGQSFHFIESFVFWQSFYGRMPLLAPTTVIGSGPSLCLKRHTYKAAGYPQLSAVGLAFA